MVRPDPDESVVAVGERLRLVRLAHGYTQDGMGRSIGITGTAWGNYEVGYRRISIDSALVLCRQCGVTLSWIYQGQVQMLPDRVLDFIVARREAAR